MAALRSVVAQIAAIVRSAGVVYVAAQLIIWNQFYAARPWLLAGPLAAMLWAVLMVAYLRRHWPSWPLAAADSGFYLLLALSAAWCVPSEIRGEAASWLFIAMASQLIVLAWFAPAVLSAPVAVAGGAAFWAGTALAQGSGTTPRAAMVPMVPMVSALLVVTATIHLVGRRLVYRRAALADVALAAADQDAQDQFVALSRNIERREHERLLHDTVLNTLTALARPSVGNVTDAVARCQHDVALMEQALGHPCGGQAAARPFGSLVAAVQAVVTECRARGLLVHVQVGYGRPAVDGAPAAPAPAAPAPAIPAPAIPAPAIPAPAIPALAIPAQAIPAQAADAITHATREALANVAEHAGTGEAWVEISDGADGVRVTVRDRGAGFDPARVGAARLGLRRSITERITDAGGQAAVTSAPGAGTEVCLRWPAGPAVATGPGPAFQARPW